MTKKTPLLSLMIVLLVLACGVTDIPFLVQPTATQPATATPIPPTVTPSPQVLPTHTFTPTLIGPSTEIADTFPPPLTATPAATSTDTAIPPSQTATPGIGLAGTGFNAINVSNSVFYFGACQPTTATLTVTVANPAQIVDVVLFTRVSNKATGGVSAWAKGVSMTMVGPGVYSRTLNSEHMGVSEDSWIQFQLVGTDVQDQIMARSPVNHDSLSLSPCP